jgi:hypothetical protein
MRLLQDLRVFSRIGEEGSQDLEIILLLVIINNGRRQAEERTEDRRASGRSWRVSVGGRARISNFEFSVKGVEIGFRDGR